MSVAQPVTAAVRETPSGHRARSMGSGRKSVLSEAARSVSARQLFRREDGPRVECLLPNTGFGFL
jgi:hypothetical protein